MRPSHHSTSIEEVDLDIDLSSLAESNARTQHFTDVRDVQPIRQRVQIVNARIGLQSRQPPQDRQRPHEALFDNGLDDIIKFAKSDASSSASNTSTDTDEDLSMRRQRKIDRDLATDDELTGSEEDDVDLDESDEHFDSSSASTESAASNESSEAPRHSSPTTASLKRSHYSGVTFESHFIHNERDQSPTCYHTLLGLQTSQTVRGPCAIYGIFNETSAGGYLLNKKHVTVDEDEMVTLQPIQRLSSASSRLSHVELEEQGRSRQSEMSVLPSQLDNRPTVPTPNPQSRFGNIDWAWVDKTRESWLARMSANKATSIVLVVQRYEPGKLMTRYRQLKVGANHVDRYGTHGSVTVPAFFARANLPSPIDPALLPTFRKILNGGLSVAVVGGQNIGKSTLARAFANGFVSQHGVCYWLDLDLGQPEFGVSGSISLSRINRQLRKENDLEAAQWIKLIHVGGARMQCPMTMTAAIQSICDFMETQSTTLRPLVINTHGWIHSTGRRITVEAMRRLQPQHLVHLRRPGDAEWVVTSILFDPRHGLNRRVVPERFLGGVPYPLPEALGQRTHGSHDTPMETMVHSLQVERTTQPKRHTLRQENWNRYFRPWVTNMGPEAVTIVDIDMRCPLLVLAHDELRPPTVDEFCAVVERSVVALGTKVSGGARKRSRTGMLHPSCIQPHEAVEQMHLFGYAFVLKANCGAEHNEGPQLRLAIPIGNTQLVSYLGKPACADSTNLVLAACPFERADTNHLSRLSKTT